MRVYTKAFRYEGLTYWGVAQAPSDDTYFIAAYYEGTPAEGRKYFIRFYIFDNGEVVVSPVAEVEVICETVYLSPLDFGKLVAKICDAVASGGFDVIAMRDEKLLQSDIYLNKYMGNKNITGTWSIMRYDSDGAKIQWQQELALIPRKTLQWQRYTGSTRSSKARNQTHPSTQGTETKQTQKPYSDSLSEIQS